MRITSASRTCVGDHVLGKVEAGGLYPCVSQCTALGAGSRCDVENRACVQLKTGSNDFWAKRCNQGIDKGSIGANGPSTVSIGLGHGKRIGETAESSTHSGKGWLHTSGSRRACRLQPITSEGWQCWHRHDRWLPATTRHCASDIIKPRERIIESIAEWGW